MARAQLSVRNFFYIISVFNSYGLMRNLSSFVHRADDWDFLWPVGWVAYPIPPRRSDFYRWLVFSSSLVAFQFGRHRAARMSFADIYLCCAAAGNSLGGINHQNHAWFWVAACLVMLPDALPTAGPRDERRP